jgi:AraC-like DNA-binding protein
MNARDAMARNLVRAPRARRGRSLPDASALESFGDVNVAPIAGILPALQELGVDPAPLLKVAGIDPAAFADPAGRVSVVRIGHLLEASAAATGKPHFGLLAGAHFEMQMLGVLGYVLRNESSVRSALRALVLHLRLHDRGAVAGLSDAVGQMAAVSYGVCTPGTKATGLIDDLALRIGVCILKTICGPGWRPSEVRLAHAAPAEASYYREHFGAPVRFNAPLSMIVFERRWLDEPVPDADATLLALLRQLIAYAEGSVTRRLNDDVRRVLRSSVLNGTADAGSVAAIFSISDRSLRRRLAEEGTTLHTLIAEARLIVARQLLEETHLSVGEIAAAMHYSDLTAFSRAFRGWTGTPPTAWRRPPQ